MRWKPGAATGGSPPVLSFKESFSETVGPGRPWGWRRVIQMQAAQGKGGSKVYWAEKTVQRTPAHLKNCSYFKMLGGSCQETKLVLSFLCFIPFFFFFKETQCQGTSSLALGQEGLLLWLVPSRPGLAMALRSWALRPGRGLPRASLIAQSVKNLPAVQETRVRFLGWENPMEKEMATHSSILAWRMDRRAWQATVHGVTIVGHDSATKTHTHTHTHTHSASQPWYLSTGTVS